MPRREILTGSGAVAFAVKMADVDVVASYPIRPYTGVMNWLSKFIADGELDAEIMYADSEHSQFEIVKHASAAGARTFVGSSGVGIEFAMEPIVIIPSNRLPVVAMIANRMLDDPGSFGTEHNESLAIRDLGWMLRWPESAQEALDFTLIAYRVSEDHRVLLPSGLCCEGNFVTHHRFSVEIPDQEQVDEFLPPLDLPHALHPDHPWTIAPQVDDRFGFEIRRQHTEGMRNAKKVYAEAHKDFARIFGRNEEPFLDEYMTEDADLAFVSWGGTCTVARAAVRSLRKEGLKIGLVRMKVTIPFPDAELQKSLARFKAVATLDCNFPSGSPHDGGVLFREARASMYEVPERPHLIGALVGLGGRTVFVDDLKVIGRELAKVAKEDKVTRDTMFVGVRE
ncbi:MAG: pyruvate ferredoxin oxidoreductase [Candidatus Bathyarchaeia archaeon]